MRMSLDATFHILTDLRHLGDPGRLCGTPFEFHLTSLLTPSSCGQTRWMHHCWHRTILGSREIDFPLCFLEFMATKKNMLEPPLPNTKRSVTLLHHEVM